MKQYLRILCIFLLCSNLFAAELVPAKKVLISQVIEHPALDKTTLGIITALQDSGYVPGNNFEVRVESAQANSALAAQIASKYVNQHPSVVVGVGTISAQSFAKYAANGKVKLVFSSVTDPLQAKLVQTIAHPGNNTTGVSNFVALEPQLKLFQSIQPGLKRIGILYNPGEPNSSSIVKKLEAICPEMDLVLIKQTAAKSADVAQAAAKLAANCDAIFISNDNTVLGALQSVVRAANAKNIPIYVSDTDAVQSGALAALGPNQYEVGYQTGKMIARVLQGEDIGTIPVEFPHKTELVINLKVAKQLNIVIPDAVLKTAGHVLQSN